MNECVDLEIGIRRDGDDYAVELRCSQPGKDTDVRSGYTRVRFDIAELNKLSLDDAEYGGYLTRQLFPQAADVGAPVGGAAGTVADSTAAGPHTILEDARSIAQAQDLPLRMRLFVGPNAPELHNLCWEKLCDPRDMRIPLLTDLKVHFSRYLSSLEWSPVCLRRKADQLRALVLVANPNLSKYPALKPVQVEEELKRVQASLSGTQLTVLAAKGPEGLKLAGRASLHDLKVHLQKGCDILYLVCHGTRDEDESQLWLEGPAGEVDRVSGHRLAAELQKLAEQPRLVVLASCQSAGTGSDIQASHRRALSAIGPRLAEACIPAVIAMQGNVAMAAAARFMPVFFQSLLVDGQIDRAMATARSQVYDPEDVVSDWWRPALFMRLKSGCIWYTPGFRGDEHEVKTWPPLLDAIKGNEELGLFCTPILGPGLADALLGSRRDLARHWAENHQFPMAFHQREDLSQVAQYLVAEWEARPLWSAWYRCLCEEVRIRHGTALSSAPPATLRELIAETVSALFQDSGPLALHCTLAKLPFRVYVTADPTNLLEEALRAAGKRPQVRVWPWRQEAEAEKAPLEAAPSPDRPLVYYLFGSFRVPESLVLTEDNLYDFVIGMTDRKNQIPFEVRSALAAHMLLFLGFPIEERSLRVLLRTIMSTEGRKAAKVPSVAAQVYPAEGLVQEPERARRYLETYFKTDKINIYWGSTDDFLRELADHWVAGGGKL